MKSLSRISLGTLVDLSDRITQDKAVSDTSLGQRDRAIGKPLASLRDRPARQLSAWLDEIAPRCPDEPPRSPGQQVDRACRWALLILGVLGLGLGWASVAGVFWYDGSRPVNVIAILAAYVLLPTVLWLLTVMAMLPMGANAWHTLGALSPGRLLPIIARRLPMESREAWETILGQMTSQGTRFGRVQKWLILGSAQVFAVAFFLGATLGALGLIVFSDLAFGWSTTLSVTADQASAGVEGLAWLWGGWWPQARPSHELVALTRYYRAQSALPGDVAALGGWWPFVLACLLFYALLPRVVLLGVARWRFRAALDQAAVHTPGVNRVLDRLNQPWIETRATSPAEPTPDADETPRQPTTATAQPGAVLINWSHFPTPDADLRNHLNDASLTVAHAGGTASLAADQETIAQAARQHAGQAVLVLAKAWEPFTMELADFLHDLRQALGDGVPIEMVPAQPDLKPADADQHQQWQRALAKQGDPWLAVCAIPPGHEKGESS